jgi:hypothetical protein
MRREHSVEHLHSTGWHPLPHPALFLPAHLPHPGLCSAYAAAQWAVVMSRGAGFLDQVVELDFQYPSEGIHKRWDGGYRITALASTSDQVRCLSCWTQELPLSAACLLLAAWRQMCVVVFFEQCCTAYRSLPGGVMWLCFPITAGKCSAIPWPIDPSAFAWCLHMCLPLQSALVLSIPRRAMSDETQETLRTSTFPSGM